MSIWIPIHRLNRILGLSQYEYLPWTDYVEISPEYIYHCVDCKVFNSRSFSDPTDFSDWTQNDHLERIAYLIVYPDDTPIDIDVGIPSIGYHHRRSIVIIDGNHRLFAAYFRGILISWQISTVKLSGPKNCLVSRWPMIP